VVIQLARLSDGTRRILTIAEIVGMEGDVISMQDLFVFDREGIGPDGEVKGHFHPTGIRPKFADQLRAYGLDLSETLLAEAPTARSARR